MQGRDLLFVIRSLVLPWAGMHSLSMSAQSSQIESRPSVGLGTDLRLESRKLTGFALALEDHLLHLAVFARVSNENRVNQYTRMTRFSNRRRNNI
jgi:hypothetical protein